MADTILKLFVRFARPRKLAGQQSRVPRDLKRRHAGRASGFAWPAVKSPLQPFGLAAPPDTKARLRETRNVTNTFIAPASLHLLHFYTASR